MQDKGTITAEYGGHGECGGIGHGGMQGADWRKRTRYCGDIGDSDVGQVVTVAGWVQRRRDLGGLVFVDVRDRSGIVQAVFQNSGGEAASIQAGGGDEAGNVKAGGGEADGLFDAAGQLRSEYVVAIRGAVRLRAPEAVNAKMATGRFEIAAARLHVHSKAETPPIYIEEGLDANEATRLKYRFLDLRRPDIQRNLMLRHRLSKAARDYFDANGFLEIETPMLTKSTPEGARDYLVPSRVYPGTFFALPQSPQLFKQLLMAAGYDRYMQIVRCFRDEDLRADRQPEFTQIDLEMSFVDADDVIAINEGFVRMLFKDLAGVALEEPLPRLTYHEAMLRFGTDKPDMRFGMEIADLSGALLGCGFKAFDDALGAGGAVRAIVAKGCSGFSRKQIDALEEAAKSRGARGMAWAAVGAAGGETRCPFAKFLREGALGAALEAARAEPGDLALFVADASADIVAGALGHLRLVVAQKLGLQKSGIYKLAWITEFPLLERDDEAGRWVAKHHPFTSPMDEDVELLGTDPGKARAKAYDIVANGMEIGGGSIRISDLGLQGKLFALLGFSPEEASARFGFLLEAFRYGVPPHGGIAYGLDRLAMALAGCESIKEVIAFPKVQTSSCLMTGAPSAVDGAQLADLGLALAGGE